MKTLEIIAKINKELFSKLIPSKDLPIYCYSVIDPRAEVFNKPYKKTNNGTH